MNDTRLEIRLPKDLLKSSQDTAKALNMHHSTFVRQAIEEKIERVKPTHKGYKMNARMEMYKDAFEHDKKSNEGKLSKEDVSNIGIAFKYARTKKCNKSCFSCFMEEQCKFCDDISESAEMYIGETMTDKSLIAMYSIEGGRLKQHKDDKGYGNS